MSRLWRPIIPVEVKCRVALRQLGYEEMAIAVALAVNDGKLGAFLTKALVCVAQHLDCTVKDLRLDHDPPLGARPKFRRGLGKKTYYQPDANDPDHLLYRPHGPEFEGSHLIKTNVRGEHGQHPDRVLIKKERRRLRKGKKRRFKRKIAARANPWPQGHRPIQSRGFQRRTP